MIKTTLLKWIIDLTPQKQLTVFLVLAISGLFAWVKILTTNDTKDRKEAYAAAELKCAEETSALKNRINTLEWRCDSIIAQQVHDKQETIILLQQMLDKSRTINNKIKHQR